MALVDSLRTTTVRPTRLVAALHVLIATFGIALGNLTASPSLPAPASDDLPLLVVSSERSHTFIVNGAFDDGGAQSLTYSAFQTNGNALPSWMKLNTQTGSFEMKPPSGATGDVLRIRVLATDNNNNRAVEEFDLVVDDVSLGCALESNSDGLARFLECGTGKTKLRGYSSGGSYRWTGPNGFNSTEKEPTVTSAGLYILKTSGCNRTQAVLVHNSDGGCSTPNKNQLPVARIDADQFSGNAPLTVNFDALLSSDPDGRVVDYSWSWDGATAAGPTPTATFSEGSHQIVLTVTDNTGAKSTDYVTVEVSTPGYVRHREFWLEAECAEVGGNWTTENNSSASNGKSVYSRSSSVSTPPSDSRDNLVRFVFNNAEKGSYNLFLRALAPDGSSNSFWIRVNGKEWVKFNGLKSGGYQWNEMSHYQPYLNDGTNTVEFAFREPNTRLDNIHLDKDQMMPFGNGRNGTNCSAPSNYPPNAVANVSTTSGVAPLTVSLDGSRSTDSDGSITEYRWSWNGGSKIAERASMTLPAGNYDVTLTVTDNDGATNSDMVSIQVEDQVMGGGSGIWLEAECAAVGSTWAKKRSSSSSNGEYLLATKQSSFDNAPSDISDNRVRFEFDAPQSGSYKLFGLINAPSSSDDSFWVRANGGPWYKWFSGIRQGNGWNWNLMGAELSLRSGSNTVDFAFREDGTMLDKVFLTNTNSQPSGHGSTAENCGSVGSVSGALASGEYYEAECTETGRTWSIQSSSGVANGKYLLATGTNMFSTPGSGNDADMIKFRAYANGSNGYHLMMRIDAPNGSSNSCWVKIDDRPWVAFTSEEDGSGLQTNGFEWRHVTADGKFFEIPLDAGYHDIVIAKREAGFKIDKIFLSSERTLPTGLGGDASNCDGNSVSMGGVAMLNAADEAEQEIDFVEGVTLYPNPVVDRLNLTVKSQYTGPVDLSIIDVNGREIQSSRQEKEAEQFTVDFNVNDLPPGVYNVQIIEGEQRTVQSFVKQ